MRAGQSDIRSIVVKREASAVFAIMADVEKLHRWSFGTWETEIAEDGIVTGTSLFDGSKLLVRIDADEGDLTIKYHLGTDRAALMPRILVRVVPGPHVGLADDHCVLTFMAWRSEAMDEDRWRRLTASHEMEAVLLKSLIETGRI
ncbi:hypothetical protein BH10PSE7_BH10PSE7_29200 [soil metagenome]